MARLAVQARTRALVRQWAPKFPALYNFRLRHVAVVQRMRGGVHDLELLGLELETSGSPLVYDIGANVGQTIITIKRMAPHARVMSFEPYLPSVVQLARVANKYEDVTVVPAACGAKTGEIRTLYVPVAHRIQFTSLATLSPPDRPGFLQFLRSSGFTWVSEENLSFMEQPVITMALDDLPYRPDFIKIDVEGLELDVLKGAQRCLKEGQPLLFIENGSRPEVMDFLRDHGYLPRGEHGVNTVFAAV